MVFAPGTILQRIYLRRRLSRLKPGVFIEVGTGSGHLSGLLLAAGWSGIGIEQDQHSAAIAETVNRDAIAARRYEVRNCDWLNASIPKVDLIVSCMVLEHLNEKEEATYLLRCREHLSSSGRIILLVPACESAWGIEDVLAGHYRRYTEPKIRTLLASWRIDHLAGLTFPVSNVLLPLSNWLVKRAEAHKRELSIEERTASSGRREVFGKTTFPALAGLMLNEVTMYPFHLLQVAFRRIPSCLVLYVEATPA